MNETEKLSTPMAIGSNYLVCFLKMAIIARQMDDYLYSLVVSVKCNNAVIS